ncbi:MAG: ABC transporter ATP-binding protein [Clostridia bacterium]|jgi:peptide/nickel transport system ATP-binding protein
MQKNDNILEVKNLKTYFPIKSGVLQRTVGHIKAVDDVSFSIKKGQTFGLVGESGCGKTTIGRSILRLVEPTAGSIIIDGVDISKLKSKELRSMRKKMQLIFQDPYSSLNPRLPVGEIIGEAVWEHYIRNQKNGTPDNELNLTKENFRDYILSVMNDCGLFPYYIDRYPHEFSGGQRQRICIARALALNPGLIIADEPVSALDVSIQAQIINLMKELQEKRNLTYLFISHDLSVVEYISDVVAVMYLGNIVEMAPKKSLFGNPLHPYTEALLSAVPYPDPAAKRNKKRIILKGDLPSPANPPVGCRFHTRCPYAKDICAQKIPEYKEVAPEHYCMCHKVNGLF